MISERRLARSLVFVGFMVNRNRLSENTLRHNNALAVKFRQCSRIAYVRTLKTVMPNKPTAMLNTIVLLGQMCRIIRIHKMTRTHAMTVAPMPIPINKSKSSALSVKIPAYVPITRIHQD